jgi:hypothetical protein
VTVQNSVVASFATRAKEQEFQAPAHARLQLTARRLPVWPARQTSWVKFARRVPFCRLRRAHGELLEAAGMIEQGKRCNDVVVQLLARGYSVPRAANRIVTEACQSAPPPGDFDLLTCHRPGQIAESDRLNARLARSDAS